uniref:Uncharacterized protein n=1 Tax=Tetranychus urticae TaxID=32264 RepID=T1KWZ7_TETUR
MLSRINKSHFEKLQLLLQLIVKVVPNNMVSTLIKSLISGSNEKEIVLLICVIGASVQIINVLNRYFSYEYLIQAHVGVPQSTLLPDVAVCFDITDMINYTRLFSTYPSVLSELGYKPETVITEQLIETVRNEPNFLVFLFEHLKINQLWDQMINKSTVYSKAVFHQVTDDSVVLRSCSSRDFFSEQTYCYAFTCSMPGKGVNSSLPVTTETSDLYKKLTKQEVFTLFVYQSFFTTIGYYYMSLMPRNQLPRGEKMQWQSQEAYSVPRKHTFFFYTITTNFLRSPFPTNCIDYKDKGYLSNSEMKDKCQINLGLQRIGTPLVSNILDYPIDSHFGYENFENHKDNETFINIVSEIVDYCERITLQPDCVEEINILTSRTPLPIFGDYTEITVEQISDPVYVITYVPKMTPLDVIISIGSVLGTWLGFSIAYSIPQLTTILGIKCFKLLPLRRQDHLQPTLLNQQIYHHKATPMTKISPESRLKSGSNDRSRRKMIHKNEPFYVYYNQQAWPLLYDIRTRPWWYR